MKLLHLRNRWKSRVKKFRGSPQARRHSNQGSLRSPGTPIPKETNLQGDHSPRTPIPEETNYWVPAWLDGAPGHQCIGWEMQSATKLVPQSTFSNYSDRPWKARLWVFEGFSVTFTSMRVPPSNCGNQALMSFAINNFLLAKFYNQGLTHVCLNAEVMVEAPSMFDDQEWQKDWCSPLTNWLNERVMEQMQLGKHHLAPADHRIGQNWFHFTRGTIDFDNGAIQRQQRDASFCYLQRNFSWWKTSKE